MNDAIKLLEQIGQSTSLNQHDSLLEMLNGLNLEPESLLQIEEKYKEFVCMIFPEDDDEDTEEGTEEDDEEKVD